MRRFLLIAAAAPGARAQLTEFSSHIVLTGFDIENFNRPNRLAHIELFGCLGRVFFDGKWEPENVRYFDRDTSRSDELQPTESFRNVSDPQYEFGTLGGDDMGKAFA